MTRSTFHFRQVDRSPELQRIVEVLKQAAHPLSALEIMVRIKDQWGKDALNISTGIGEIGKNAGYGILSLRPRSRLEQHRYALLSAPGWTPTWQADTTQGAPTRHHGRPEEDEDIEPEHPAAPRICKLERCFTEIPQSGPPFCCNEHRDEFFKERA